MRSLNGKREAIVELPFDDGVEVNWGHVPPCELNEPFFFRLRADPTKDIAGMMVLGGNLTRPGFATGDVGERDRIIIMVSESGEIGSISLREMDETSIGFVRMMVADENITFHGGGEEHQERRR